jgi:hypothetical protein
MEGRGHALQACHAMHGRHQCCGSGMFIQDPRFFSIPDTDATKKGGGKIRNSLQFNFKFHKLKIIKLLEQVPIKI